MKAILLLILFLTSPLSAQALKHDRLTGTVWDCSLDGKAVGTLTFKEGNVVTPSWQAETEWKPILNGVEIFGVQLVYENQSFAGFSTTGKSVTLTLAAGGPEPTPAPATTMTAASPEPASAAPAPTPDVTFEKLPAVKLARGQDHRFTISGQKTAFGRSTNRTWETSWGSYIEEIERSATYQFKVGHFGGEGAGFFEVLFLGKDSNGDPIPYAFDSIRMTVNGDTAFEFDIFHKSTDSMYRALNIRIKEGTKPDSWVAWMRSGDTIMGLAAGRGSLVDYYEARPMELVALAKEVVKKQ